jgi:hypothetical protein
MLGWYIIIRNKIQRCIKSATVKASIARLTCTYGILKRNESIINKLPSLLRRHLLVANRTLPHTRPFLPLINLVTFSFMLYLGRG